MRRLLLGTLLLAGTARAADMDDLLAALRQARTLAARGEVQVQVYFPPRAVPESTAATLPAVPFRPALLAERFTVTRQDAPPVAGRAVSRFDLTPKAGQAARWVLWVDRAWNLPLAYEEWTPGGTLARRAALTRVEGQPLRRAQKVPAVPDGLRAAVLAALPGLRFPAGFTPTGVQARAEGGLEVTLSDGANVLALVVAPRDVRAAPGVSSRRVGARFVWLVGNLPDAPLREALAGIRHLREEALGTFLPVADSKK